MLNAPAIERIAFQPAIEIPHSDHWIWSQRTIGEDMMSFKRSAVLVAFEIVVHWVKPVKMRASTPA
jgi:hypothetical protein